MASLLAVALAAGASCAAREGDAPPTPEKTARVSSAVASCVKQLEAIGPGPPDQPGAWLALKTDGTVWMTPQDANGRWQGKPAAPYRVKSLGNTVTSLMDVDAETQTYCAVKADHSLYCWGSNVNGNLGVGSTVDAIVPVRVMGPGNVLANATASVTTGDGVTCAVTTGGDLYCWGLNNFGQVGTGLGAAGETICGGQDGERCFTSPTQIRGPGDALVGKVAKASAGFDHTCALTTTGDVYCWGANGYGQVGIGAEAVAIDQPTPQRVPGLANVLALSAGGFFACAIAGDAPNATAGTVYCWGQNLQGMIGIGILPGDPDQPSPMPLALGKDNTKVDTGVRVGCAIKSGGAVRCWGWNDRGQIGDGTFEDRSPPVTPLGLTSGATHLAVGKHTACVVQSTAAYCWGASVFLDGDYPTPFDAGADPFPFMAAHTTPKVVDFCSLAPAADAGGGGVPGDACGSDAECAGDYPVCHATLKVCVQCSATNAKACAGAAPTCDVSTGQCSIACAKDADCGDGASGRVCDDAARVCRDGCRGAGGNSCPAGALCSSTTSTPGLCEPSASAGADASGSGREAGVAPPPPEVHKGGCAVAARDAGPRSDGGAAGWSLGLVGFATIVRSARRRRRGVCL